VPVTERERARTQRVLYKLTDPYLRFWFRFVSPHQSSLQLGHAERVWETRVTPELDEFVARTTWEEICAQFVLQAAMLDAGDLRFNHLGRWWDGEDEIDIVGTLDNRVTLVGECKWTAAPVDERALNALRRKALKLNIEDEPLWVLASRSGFTQGLRRLAERGGVLLIEPRDLYA
jgi:AAA+ ATPase superfamily predicted ATPase